MGTPSVELLRRAGGVDVVLTAGSLPCGHDEPNSARLAQRPYSGFSPLLAKTQVPFLVGIRAQLKETQTVTVQAVTWRGTLPHTGHTHAKHAKKEEHKGTPHPPRPATDWANKQPDFLLSAGTPHVV